MLLRNLTKYEEIVKPLELTHEDYKNVMKVMNHHMKLGLGVDSNSQADIKMFVTYVRDVPTGRESGDFLALDLGGTNFRVLLITLDKKDVSMQSTIFEIPKHIMEGSGTQLFDHIAGCIETFIKEKKLSTTTPLPLGFTFSFPCKQEGLASARLVTWTKGFTCSGVVGEDIVPLLHEAIERKGLNVKCVAVINDTVGALMSCAHEDSTCRIGLILGTGTNACYMESLENVHQWDGDSDPPRQVIINTEWGAFGNSNSLDFITTEFDRSVDQISKNPGRQIYEKMISGMYMGEIVRQVLLKLIEAGCLFDQEPSEELLTPERFYTKYVSEIESDAEFEVAKTRQVLEELNITKYKLGDCLVLREVCKLVSSRAAYLAAAGISVLLERVSEDFVTVGVDGSLYRYHPNFHNLITEKITQLVPDKKFQLMLSHDGSGKGAALVAAVASKS